MDQQQDEIIRKFEELKKEMDGVKNILPKFEESDMVSKKVAANELLKLHEKTYYLSILSVFVTVTLLVASIINRYFFFGSAIVLLLLVAFPQFQSKNMIKYLTEKYGLERNLIIFQKKK